MRPPVTVGATDTEVVTMAQPPVILTLDYGTWAAALELAGLISYRLGDPPVPFCPCTPLDLDTAQQLLAQGRDTLRLALHHPAHD